MYNKKFIILSSIFITTVLFTSCGSSSSSNYMESSSSPNLSSSSSSSGSANLVNTLDSTSSSSVSKSTQSGQTSMDYQSNSNLNTKSSNSNTESYNKINENSFINTKSEPISTFSIDVDTASYSNIRRFISQNQKPPKDAIRIEEMINYFDYKYPVPEGNVPFSINMEAGKCPWNDKHNLVLIGLKGREVNIDNISGSNFVFLIDSSGSMADANKLPLLKSSFEILVKKLRPQDKISIVTYSGSAGLILDSTSGDKKDKILEAIGNLRAGGATAGGEGIQLAYNIAKENFIPNGNNRVILATDGDFNVGASSDAEMEKLIEKKRQDGIFLSVLGFGTGNYKDSKMESLADKGNGNYAYIDNPSEAKKVLGEQIWGTLYTIAKDVKIQVDFNPLKIKGYRLIGYENRLLNKEDFSNDKKDAGDIGLGLTVTALYEIIPANSDEKVEDTTSSKYQKSETIISDSLMTLSLRYKDPNKNESKLLTGEVKEKNIIQSTMSNNYIFASSVAEFGLLLQHSQYMGGSSFEHVLKSAKDSLGQDENGYRKEFIQLVERAKEIEN